MLWLSVQSPFSFRTVDSRNLKKSTDVIIAHGTKMDTRGLKRHPDFPVGISGHTGVFRCFVTIIYD